MAIHAGRHGHIGELRQPLLFTDITVALGAADLRTRMGRVAEDHAGFQAGAMLNRQSSVSVEFSVASLALRGIRKPGTGVLDRAGVALLARPPQIGVFLMVKRNRLRCGRQSGDGNE